MLADPTTLRCGNICVQASGVQESYSVKPMDTPKYSSINVEGVNLVGGFRRRAGRCINSASSAMDEGARKTPDAESNSVKEGRFFLM